MMKNFTISAAGVAALLVSALPLQAEESQANSWNLTEEEASTFAATVVDPLCEFAGDCPENCGDGTRQLALKTTDDEMVIVSKNGQPQFNGAVADLLAFCGQDIEVDGLFTGFGGVKIYQVQLIRVAGEAEWQKANTWLDAWKAANPDVAEGEGPWFRRDPAVLERIERDGYLGLGKDADAKFIAEW